MVVSQTANLTHGPSFGHNLSFKNPNGSCKPILTIFVLRFFQLYKELLNKLSFDPCNGPLKIQESIRIPTPKVGANLGVWGFIPSHSLALPGTWNVIPGLNFWLAPLQTLALVMNPRLELQHVKRCTWYFYINDQFIGVNYLPKYTYPWIFWRHKYYWTKFG